MERNQALMAIRKFSDSVRRVFDPAMVILYGSYARGTQTESSDIDVAVVVDQVVGDYLDQEAMLYRIRREIDVSFRQAWVVENFGVWRPRRGAGSS